MQITTRTEYSVRALCELCFSENPISLKVLSKEHKLPFKYLEHLFRDLKNSGIVYSVAGSKGGYRLKRPAEEITLLDILRAVDKDPTIHKCLQTKDAEYCLGESCRFHIIWKKINVYIEEYYEKITLAGIIEEI
ncbi:MAG: Rrf2 family transcriptional regulator [Candidatus Cloacimonetes bacterium]|nr:Rrf2 family transcriptional regulator [Candidatus Cloacimonadota bacterium]